MSPVVRILLLALIIIGAELFMRAAAHLSPRFDAFVQRVRFPPPRYELSRDYSGEKVEQLRARIRARK